MKRRRGEIFISPDGGETVYVQKKDGSRGRLVSQSQYAKQLETVQEEEGHVYHVRVLATVSYTHLTLPTKA